MRLTAQQGVAFPNYRLSILKIPIPKSSESVIDSYRKIFPARIAICSIFFVERYEPPTPAAQNLTQLNGQGRR
jgi:hypothetical protein